MFKPNVQDDYERECQALDNLHHQYIIKKIQSKNNKILLEYCCNGNIHQYLHPAKPWPDALIRFYFR